MGDKALPNGVSFSDRVVLSRVSDNIAESFHENHHSYLPYLNRVTISNHGAFIDNELVAVVTYAMPRRSAPIRDVPPEKIAEVARVTVGVEMPNLASCVMAKSQDRFAERRGAKNDIRMLLTFVFDDWEGSMYKALRGKGWECDGIADTKPSGNRTNREAQYTEKTRWICPIRQHVEQHKQTTVADF